MASVSAACSRFGTSMQLSPKTSSRQRETVDKICVIVEQLALTPDAAVTPESKFSDVGADSLDTVEIVKKLEEEFDITVPEDNSGNIATIQEAAALIEKLVEQKVAT